MTQALQLLGWTLLLAGPGIIFGIAAGFVILEEARGFRERNLDHLRWRESTLEHPACWRWCDGCGEESDRVARQARSPEPPRVLLCEACAPHWKEKRKT